MTENEFIKIAGAIKTYFPRDNVFPTRESMELWYDMVKDLDYAVVASGLKAYVATNKFAPSISDLRDFSTRITNKQHLNESEAWSLVNKAICNSTYKSVEEFEKLPADIQKAVGSPEQLRSWAMDEDYNESVISSGFKRVYRNVIEYRIGNEQMQENERSKIEANETTSYLPHTNGKHQQAINVSSNLIEVVNEDDSHLKRGDFVPDYTERLKQLREELANDTKTAQG